MGLYSALEGATHEVQGVHADARQIRITTAGKVVLSRVKAIGVGHRHVGRARGQILRRPRGIGNGAHRQPQIGLAMGADAIRELPSAIFRTRETIISRRSNFSRR